MIFYWNKQKLDLPNLAFLIEKILKKLIFIYNKFIYKWIKS